MACKKNQPGTPCCGGDDGGCVDGTLCTRFRGCDGAGGVGFAVAITRDSDGATVASYSSADYADGFVDCTTLAGGTAYTISATKARWNDLVWHLVTPCKSTPWTLDVELSLSPAEGYVCPCPGIGCTEPLKLPFTVNDGLGDVVCDGSSLPPGTPYSGMGYGCAQRHVDSGAEGCCGEADPYTGLTVLKPIMTPVLFHGLPCGAGTSVLNQCIATVGPINPATGQGAPLRVLAAGGCDSAGDPCPQFFHGVELPFQGCGNLNQVGPIEVLSCSPFMARLTAEAVGCMHEIYGDTATITWTEAS